MEQVSMGESKGIVAQAKASGIGAKLTLLPMESYPSGEFSQIKERRACRSSGCP